MDSSRQEFPSTLWSDVLSAGAGSPRALAVLCERYHRAVYAFVLRSVNHDAEARDVAQEFFAFILEGHVLQDAEPQRGRFRPFLRTCVRNFVNNRRERERAAKRGGDRAVFPLDAAVAERVASRRNLTPDEHFELTWAVDVVRRALVRLRAEMKPEAAAAFEAAFGKEDLGYRAIGDRVGMQEDAVAQSVGRARTRLRALVRDELRATVRSDADLEEEWADLVAILSRCGFGLESP